MMAVIIDVAGCCRGCWRCYGMSLNCHQDPCRCDRPCICNISEEEYVKGCKRHYGRTDQRPKEPAPNWYSGKRCPTCDPHERFTAKNDCITCHGSGAIMKSKLDYQVRCLEPLAESKWKVCENEAQRYIWIFQHKVWLPVCNVHFNKHVRQADYSEVG